MEQRWNLVLLFLGPRMKITSVSLIWNFSFLRLVLDGGERMVLGAEEAAVVTND